MSPKRILLVSPVPTHPPTAGNRTRLLGLARDLRGLGHEVHLLHVLDVAGDEAAMRSFFDGRLHVVPNPRDEGRNPWHLRLLDRVAPGRALAPGFRLLVDVDDLLSPELEREVARLARALEPDVVVVAYAFYSGLLRHFGPSTTKILDTLDRLGGRHRRFWRRGRRARMVSLSRRAERRALARADRILAIQDEERAQLSRLCDRPVLTLGHRVDLRPLPLPDPDAPPRLAFVSGPGVSVLSINRFIDRVLPRLRRRFPDLVLDVAGPICDDPALRRTDGVRRHGVIEEISKLLDGAHVFVNPVEVGTGIHVKNLEAFGHGRPAVLHRAAARGIREGAGRAFLVASSVRGFERRIARILEDRPFAERLAREAHGFAEALNERARGQLAAALRDA